MNNIKNNHKSEVNEGKQKEIVFCFSRIMFLVFGKGNQTGQGRNERSKTSDIYCRKKTVIVRGEMRQQHGTRYVADALTGKNAEQQCVHWQQSGEKSTDSRDSC